MLVFVLVLAAGACAGTPAEESKEPASTPSENNSQETSAEESHELFYNLPKDVNYEGETVTFLVVGDYSELYKSVEVMPQESSYETLQRAVQDRNNLVSERFGVEITEVRTTSGADMLDKIRSSSMS